MPSDSSPWAGEPVLYENDSFYAIFDRYPVRRGHTLIVSRRDVSALFDLTEQEFVALRGALVQVKTLLDSMFHPDGYNVGVNCGSAAGQTIDRVHIHVIPRHTGDVPDPTGGIRNLIPGLVKYDGLPRSGE
jgi:diadenosine tetraphosphate (Ap4A) HIT family hydrolase